MRKVLLVLALLLVPALAFAQAPPPATQLTWVRSYWVKPTQGSTFMRMLNTESAPVLDKLIADKTISAWGVVAPMTRMKDGPSHLIFVTADNWAGIDRMVNALDAADAAMKPADRDASDAAFNNAVNGFEDMVLHNLVSGAATSPASMPKYLYVQNYTVKPGKVRDAVQLWKDALLPSYSKLAKSGDVMNFGLSEISISGDPRFTHMGWQFVSDLGKLDTLGSTMDAAMSARTPAENSMINGRLMDDLDPAMPEQIFRVMLMHAGR